MSQVLAKQKNTLFDFLSKEQREKLGIKEEGNKDAKEKSTKSKK
jgi:hypothetical protein